MVGRGPSSALCKAFNEVLEMLITNVPLAMLGVTDVDRAASILDQTAAAAEA